MDFSWRTRASCLSCGVDYENIDPATIIETNERYYVVCASCLQLVHVSGIGDYSPKQSIKMKYHANCKDTIEDLLKMESAGNKNAKLVLHEIKVMRVKMGLDPLRFPYE